MCGWGLFTVYLFIIFYFIFEPRKKKFLNIFKELTLTWKSMSIVTEISKCLHTIDFFLPFSNRTQILNQLYCYSPKRLHFPVSFAAKCSHRTKFYPVKYKWKCCKGLQGSLKRDRTLFIHPVTRNTVVMTRTLLVILNHEDNCHSLRDVRVGRGLNPWWLYDSNIPAWTFHLWIFFCVWEISKRLVLSKTVFFRSPFLAA